MFHFTKTILFYRFADILPKSFPRVHSPEKKFSKRAKSWTEFLGLVNISTIFFRTDKIREGIFPWNFVHTKNSTRRRQRRRIEIYSSFDKKECGCWREEHCRSGLLKRWRANPYTPSRINRSVQRTEGNSMLARHEFVKFECNCVKIILKNLGPEPRPSNIGVQNRVNYARIADRPLIHIS